MKNLIKRMIATALVASMIFGGALTSYAAQWKQDSVGWWYQEDNGSWPANTWKQIGGNYYYFGADGYMLANTTTPDGYYVDGNGAWVQNNQTVTSNYDSAHPLAGVVDKWNLRLTKDSTALNTSYVSSNNVQAMLTNQMDQYYTPPVLDQYFTDENGNRGIVTSETFYANQKYDQDLYNWYCNWLSSFDFQNMSEMERAKEIQKVLAATRYDTEYEQNPVSSPYRFDYAVLIDKKGICSEFAMAVKSLCSSIGLKSEVAGGTHAWYYVHVDGQRYVGQNGTLDLTNPVTETDYHSGTSSSGFYDQLNDFYNNR